MKLLKSAIQNLILLATSFLFITFVLFIFFEFLPEMPKKLGLTKIHYYALKERYIEDEDLVLRMKPNYKYQGFFTGDIVGLEKGSRPEPYLAIYDDHGFRNPSTPQKSDILFLGDSFIEFGLNLEDTVPARVAKQSDKSMANLALGWYGPNQYLATLIKFGLDLKPKNVFFCFFEGNDLRDMRQFDKWRKGGDYYHFNILSKNFLMKYFITLKDIGVYIAKMVLRRWDDRKVTIQLNGKSHETVFVYNIDSRSRNELLESSEIKELTNIFKELKTLSHKKKFKAHVVFIPSKAHIYLPLLSEQDLKTYEDSSNNRKVLEGVVKELAQNAGLNWLSLSKAFNGAVKDGHEVYYLSDTHWNSHGREIATELLSEALNN